MDRSHKLQQEKIQKMNEIIEANEIFANNSYMESELLRKKKNFRLQYGHELRAQCKYEKLEKVGFITYALYVTYKFVMLKIEFSFLRIKLLLRHINYRKFSKKTRHTKLN